MPVFGEARVNCKKRCNKSNCNICKMIENCAKALDDKNIILTKGRKKRESGITDINLQDGTE